MTSQNVVKFEVSLEIDLNLKKGRFKNCRSYSKYSPSGMKPRPRLHFDRRYRQEEAKNTLSKSPIVLRCNIFFDIYRNTQKTDRRKGIFEQLA